MGEKRLFVVINSKCGGKSLRVIQKQWAEVKQCILDAEPTLKIEEYWTQFPGDVPSRAAVFAPGVPVAVVCVGGDGTFHLVANRLYGTEVPTAIVPLGTGNGLAASFGVLDAREAARRIGSLARESANRQELCERSERLDAMHYEIHTAPLKRGRSTSRPAQERRCCAWLLPARIKRTFGTDESAAASSPKSHEQAVDDESMSSESARSASQSSLTDRWNGYAFLSVSIGMIADIDIRTECIRCIGDIRFDLGSIWYILRKRTFSAVVEYRHVFQDSQSDLGWRPADELTETIPLQEYALIVVMNVSHASPKARFAPLARPHDGCIDVIMVPASVSRFRLIRYMLQIESGEHIHDPCCRYFKCSWIRIQLDPPQLVSLDGEARYRVRSVVLEQGGDHLPVVAANRVAVSG
ncbi:hypothetical protein F1559_000889 [Cyanidiococcus yangmingshanensis]|uniref:DAGKc domain-containing protein n=1 Tax=Cyanidiococcus yangmingshanensis TaxID=2690220 RepID=A0A7J7IPR8_9RHOD|nr:hypothetical protein F1559_000889 [Cyanidiococcus yangmingshanensis]